jgi:hypothetical protein
LRKTSFRHIKNTSVPLLEEEPLLFEEDPVRGEPLGPVWRNAGQPVEEKRGGKKS